MSPPLGAVRIVRTGQNTYDVRSDTDKPKAHNPETPHRIGLSHSHSYGYKDIVRENHQNQEGLKRSQRMTALSASIARGYAKHLGLGVPVALKAAPQKPNTRPIPGPRPATPAPARPATPAVSTPPVEKASPKPVATYQRPKESLIPAWKRDSAPQPAAKPETKMAKAPARKTPTTKEERELAALDAQTKALANQGSSTGRVRTDTDPVGLQQNQNDTGAGKLKMSGNTGGPVGPSKRSWSIEDLKASAAKAEVTVTAAPKAVSIKTGKEFNAGGTSVIPSKDHTYNADFRKTDDTSEGNELKFTQFVPGGASGRGGREVKFALVVSKDLLATPESRAALRDRMAKVVDASLGKESMKPEEREAVVIALKMRLDEKLAELAGVPASVPPAGNKPKSQGGRCNPADENNQCQ